MAQNNDIRLNNEAAVRGGRASSQTDEQNQQASDANTQPAGTFNSILTSTLNHFARRLAAVEDRLEQEYLEDCTDPNIRWNRISSGAD